MRASVIAKQYRIWRNFQASKAISLILLLACFISQAMHYSNKYLLATVELSLASKDVHE
mgnify:CR=1 FL=1